ncbi:glycosyltransferase family 4 protein [Patescibacteria group bacterium]|nr:glycosyltransferase family 4 protein [Patescibacteria group bacterium]MBU1890854.1 glycosyltransferase family 4 protein [Patescibacteria group bacterium]
MTVLFITRKYPPQVGGMERFSFELFRHLNIDKRLVAHSQGSRLAIIWIAPSLLIRGLLQAPGSDIIYIADGVLAPIGWLIGLITRKPVVVTIHGLELTYQMPLFKKVMVYFYRNLNHIITVSENSRQLAVKLGIQPNRVSVIPNGVSISENTKKFERSDLTNRIGLNTDNQFVLLSMGRLVKRKGIKWFINEVCPQMKNNWLYVIAGAGPEEEQIKKAISETDLGDRIIMLGRVSEEDKELLLQTSDCFVMPNIPVSGDVEGFGITAIEAAAHGLPVVASRLEGLNDAIIDSYNGYLVKHGKPEAFMKKISDLADCKNLHTISDKIATYTKKYYNWKYISHLYIEEFKKLLPHV